MDKNTPWVFERGFINGKQCSKDYKEVAGLGNKGEKFLAGLLHVE